MTVVLIDGDIVAYTSAFHAQAGDNTQDEAKRKIDTTIRWTLTKTEATSHQVYLTGSNNYRQKVDVTYKAHRTSPKPSLLPWCREYLRWEWGAIVSQGEEADDLIAMEVARMDYTDVIVASVDKDFLQLGVPVYNWRKDEMVEPTREEGLQFFYKQILMGDSADNIKGIPGVGPKGAERLLEGVWDEQALYGICLGAYEGAMLTEDDLIRNARLLWLRREPGEMWEPPNG